jgi:hypothetical protein
MTTLKPSGLTWIKILEICQIWKTPWSLDRLLVQCASR